MTHGDADLRRAFSARNGVATSACPDPAEYLDLAEDRASPATAQRLVEHAVDCPACSAALHAAREVAPPVSVPARSPRRSWAFVAIPLAAAAAVLLALMVRSPTPSTDSPLRSGEATMVQTDLDGTSIARDAPTLRWDPSRDASAYDVEVTTGALDLVASGHDLAEPRFTIPADVVDALGPQTKLLWRVRVIDHDGAGRWSPTFTTTLQ